jgi:putative nucleotidyltransferase with HDIG domain
MGVPAEQQLSPLGERRALRVAALAGETARCLRLPPAQRESLEEAARRRYGYAHLLEPRALERLLEELIGPGWNHLVGGLSPGAKAVAAKPQVASGQRGVTVPQEALPLLGEILEIATCFEDRIEFLPYERVTGEQVLDELSRVAAELGVRPAVVAALASLQRVRVEQLVERVYRLPVFPLVALRALELARAEDTSVSEIEKLVSADQVLAGRLIEAANSSLYSPARRIASLRQAVAYIGLEAARRVLMAAVFHPLFASAGLRGLWRHSLEVSQLAEYFAEAGGRVPPEEAFLAGLVHDVGRLALETAQGEDVIAYKRMLEKGCEPVFAEMALCGFDHGLAGAGIVRFWSFPEHLAQAVQDHHHPEHSSSELAAILYLAEFWSDAEEDLPSGVRLEAALQRTGLSWDALRDAHVRPGSLAELLGNAA